MTKKKFKEMSLQELEQWLVTDDKNQLKKNNLYNLEDKKSEEKLFKIIKEILTILKEGFNKSHKGEKFTISNISNELSKKYNIQYSAISGLILFIVTVWDSVDLRIGSAGGVVSLRDDFSDLDRDLVLKLIKEKKSILGESEGSDDKDEEDA